MKRLLLTMCLTLLATISLAQDRVAVERLAKAVGVPEVLEIMRLEGLKSATELGESYLGGTDPGWLAEIEMIYSVPGLQERVLDGMATGIAGADPADTAAFFETELGARIVGLEISAREAFLDPGVEAAAEDYAADLPETDPARHAMISEFIDVNDLLEANITGALNSNFIFLKSLYEATGADDGPSQSEMLNDIYSQEPEIRESTLTWLHAYLTLAYRPLSDDELEQYVEFSKSDAGRLLNRALFEGFDTMFNEVSRALGETLGRLSVADAL